MGDTNKLLDRAMRALRPFAEVAERLPQLNTSESFFAVPDENGELIHIRYSDLFRAMRILRKWDAIQQMLSETQPIFPVLGEGEHEDER